MSSLTNSACLFILPVALYLMLSQCPVGASARKCHSIYKGFAQCLMSLGDSMTDVAHQDDNPDDPHNLHSVCRSWDQFHDCANGAMAGCPEEAAMVWESLRQESKKMQFSGNLYDMCSPRSAQPAPREDINQESLRGHATTPRHAASPAHFPFLLLLLPLLSLLSWIQ